MLSVCTNAGQQCLCCKGSLSGYRSETRRLLHLCHTSAAKIQTSIELSLATGFRYICPIYLIIGHAWFVSVNVYNCFRRFRFKLDVIRSPSLTPLCCISLRIRKVICFSFYSIQHTHSAFGMQMYVLLPLTGNFVEV